MPEDRYQMSDIRCQKTDARKQMAEKNKPCSKVLPLNIPMRQFSSP
jgi:hypothetical protein